jgi:uncharacterized protein YecT (DUF1311 family)
MKSALIILFAVLPFFSAIGQTHIEITPELLKKIKQTIEKEIPGLKQQLEKKQISPVEIEFTIDTFRAERFMKEYINLTQSDFGMRDAAYETANVYDGLLNKYYKKLLSVLKGDDKKVLIKTQKAWLTFRDNENELVGTISKDEYAGGGTLQQLTESSIYLELIKNRTIAIFDHYTRATQTY